ncbi:class II aaRS and biotin synthetase [Flagelloscypha sp. PMI_526]|nr:class II aaRS and biotin synthetase [Flagelloscypha sp. PMI_526]
MNVLVYSGSETVSTALTRTLHLLKSILVPNYLVQPITLAALTKDPWASNCALLVVPQCRNFQPNDRVSNSILDFVNSGGRFLALSAGTMSKSPESAKLPLKFNCGNTVVIPEFMSSDRTRSGPIGVMFKDGSTLGGVEQHASPLAYHDSDTLTLLAEDGELPAAFVGTSGSGKVLVSSPSIELVEVDGPHPIRFFMQNLGLVIPNNAGHPRVAPQPQLLLSSPQHPDIVTSVIGKLQSTLNVQQLTELRDANDHFYFHPVSQLQQLSDAASSSQDIPADLNVWPKHIILTTPGWLPSPKVTPQFDLSLFFGQLSKSKSSNASTQWSLGELLLYGEAVTSTQTLLDKNPTLLAALSTPLVSIAARQLSGRGRGSNSWLSPAGCLQFSVLLRLDLANFKAHKLVFVQYLFALAVCEACRDSDVLGPYGQAVRLKWPNDIYAIHGGEKKIGGILVNTTFKGGKVDIIIGCGLNVLNVAPITSLAQLLPGQNEVDLRLEKTAAVILTRFERIWSEFLLEGGSFEPFLDLYLERWLHSDQLVTLTTLDPPQPVRVVGITLDHGLLRTMPEVKRDSQPQFYDLQPDGNSFDLMAGLIRAKS